MAGLRHPSSNDLAARVREYQVRADWPVGVDQGMESFAGSRIGPSMQIAGEIAWRGSLQVAGTCRGRLAGGDLGIESGGRVSGVVEVDNLDCAGSLQGQVIASSCTLRRGACQSGRVRTHHLSLEPGAALDIISPRDISRLPSAEAALLPQAEVP